jgi:hypothetical protein
MKEDKCTFSFLSFLTFTLHFNFLSFLC